MTQQEQHQVFEALHRIRRISAVATYTEMYRAMREIIATCEDTLALLKSQAPAEQPSPERTPCECRKALQDLVDTLPSECSCHEAYTSRKLLDPNCLYCELRIELDAARAALSAPCSGVPVSEVLEALKPFAEVPIHPQDGDRWIPRFSTPNTAHFRKLQALYQRLQRGQEGASGE